jgi:hypothetical protein
MKRSKIILGVSAWLMLSALFALWTVASGPGELGSSDRLQNLAGVVVAATVSIGLFLHRRWAMWLYFAYAAIGLLLFLLGGDLEVASGKGGLMVGIALVAVLVPAVLIWIRRDRLGPNAAEPSNA